MQTFDEFNRAFWAKKEHVDIAESIIKDRKKEIVAEEDTPESDRIQG